MQASLDRADQCTVEDLGPWFHNLHLPDGQQTCPDHWAGDFPRWKWLELEPHLPTDMGGWRVLDIGCNAGFYSFELARRGADVLGIDINPHYLAQARWAADRMQLHDVRFEQRQVYELGRTGERFDLILFMGVFYHLRYPMLVLDILSHLRPRLMVFQTLIQGPDAVSEYAEEDCDFSTRDRLSAADWPHLAFVETTFCGDPTNWWVPNLAAITGMLRAAGFIILARPGAETWLCRDGGRSPATLDGAEFEAARGMAGNAVSGEET